MKDAIQIILSAALGAVLLYLFIGRGGEVPPIEKLKIIRDTSYVERVRPKLVMNKIKPTKIIRSADSVPAPARFTATLDTITQTDTISLGYAYPENEFFIGISPKPDTLARERIILLPEDVNQKKENSWLTPVIGIGAAIIGILLGLAIN